MPIIQTSTNADAVSAFDIKTSSLDEAWAHLGSSAAGLSQAEAAERIARYGHNEIVEKKRSPILDFLHRYWGPMPWLLEAAMILAFLLGHSLEAYMIFALLTVNAVIGYRHARNSQKAVDLLKSRLALSMRVLRGGEWISLPAREAVPGDLVSVKLGEIVPADAKIVDGDLSVDQSSLTGESLPAELGPGDPVYSGSPIKRGEARCLVAYTGSETYFGKTAKLVETAKPKSHQEEVMMSIVRYMMYLGIVASVLVAVYALALHIHPVVVLTFVVIFLMGAVPVALPAVLTIVQSVGALQLSRKGAVVTRLEAIEDAASIDTLCFDKTGTITKNELAVAELFTVEGRTKEELMRLAVLATNQEGKDLIDAAIVADPTANKAELALYSRVSYMPFDPSIKRTEAVVEKNGLKTRIAKGAPKVILELCGTDGKDPIGAAITAAVEGYSRKGYRSIAVAASEGGEEGTMRPVGIVALSDPPRVDSRAMIASVRALGIRPVMLTGDDDAIAVQVAGAVGIGDKILREADIKNLSDAERAERISAADGVAGIYPEDKFSIVKAFQAEGRMVGMTGDGVNDAPALKQAEMGIAVDGASDVAKASAGIVLTENGLAVIVHSIEISRQIYQRMLSWVINKVTKVISFIGILTVSFFWLKQLPLSLLGTSLLVFANDFATMSLATDNAPGTPKPNQWKVGSIVTASVVPGILFMLQGLGAIALGLYVFHLDMSALGTVLLLNLVFGSQFRVLTVRERGHFWSSMPGRGLIRTSVAVIVIFAALGIFGILMPAISVAQVALILGYTALCSVATDFPKVYMFRRFGL
jgi:H+-transporting ATPase